MTKPLAAVALAISFTDSINRRDLAGVSELMSSDHRLEVFDEDPLIGKQANWDAWRLLRQLSQLCDLSAPDG
jgi:hypothetical protein